MGTRYVWELYKSIVKVNSPIAGNVGNSMEVSGSVTLASSFTFTGGKFYPAGDTMELGYTNPIVSNYPYAFLESPATEVYTFDGTTGVGTLRWDLTTTNTTTHLKIVHPSLTSLTYTIYTLTADTTTVTYDKGSYVGYTASRYSGAYSGNDDTYFYVYAGSDCIDPVSVECTTPIPGESVTITVTPRSNTYGGTIKYRYSYSIDGGTTWTNLSTSSTTSTSATMTVPAGAEQFRARVITSDNYGYTSADYIYSNSYSIKSSCGAAGVSGAVREISAVVCVGGVVKTDVTMQHAVDGVIKSS